MGVNLREKKEEGLQNGLEKNLIKRLLQLLGRVNSHCVSSLSIIRPALIMIQSS